MNDKLRLSGVHERIRLQFAQDFAEVAKEQGLTEKVLARRLSITKKKLRRLIWSEDLTFNDMVKLIDALGGTYHPFILIAGWPEDRQSKQKRNVTLVEKITTKLEGRGYE